LQKEIKLSAKKNSKTKKLIVVIVAVWIVIFVGVGAIIALVLSGTIQLGGANTAEGVAPLARLEEGSLANDFELGDLKGGSIRLSDLRGKPVVLNYWATWCGPCIEEMPMFQAYSEQYSNFTMIGINQAEGIDKVAPFVERMGLTYPVLLDLNSKVTQAYKVFLLPTTFFIDEEGMIRFRHYGIMTQDQFQYYLRTLGAVE